MSSIETAVTPASPPQIPEKKKITVFEFYYKTIKALLKKYFSETHYNDNNKKIDEFALYGMFEFEYGKLLSIFQEPMNAEKRLDAVINTLDKVNLLKKKINLENSLSLTRFITCLGEEVSKITLLIQQQEEAMQAYRE